MALVTRFISYQIPENSDYDQLKVYTSATEGGAYSLVKTFNYTYPTRATEWDSLDTTSWYKIRFYNSVSGFYSPYSEPFFGGAYDESQPFASVTSTFDGAGFASVSGFYEVTNLKTEQVPVGDTQAALKTAKAYIDLLTDDQSPYRYSREYGTDITRRKYNAQLELMKTAEIYFGAALIYQDLSDDKFMVGLSGSLPTLSAPADIVASGIPPEYVYPSGTNSAFSVGQTSISDQTTTNSVEAARFNLEKTLSVAQYNNEKNLLFADYIDKKSYERNIREGEFLQGMSTRYADKAKALIDVFKPTSVSLSYGSAFSGQKFVSPGTIYSFATGGSLSESVFNSNVADLTGIGTQFASGLYELDSTAMADNAVNGVSGVAVAPLESATTVVDARLVVNGVTYWLDSWTDHNANLQNGKAGTDDGTIGFSLDFQQEGGVSIIWNYTELVGGFAITDTDDITLTYWTI